MALWHLRPTRVHNPPTFANNQCLQSRSYDIMIHEPSLFASQPAGDARWMLMTNGNSEIRLFSILTIATFVVPSRISERPLRTPKKCLEILT
jgi:hypothetical protein